jgi:Domain of unknown function (DUF4926)
MALITHEDLVALFDIIRRPEDYKPYGQRDREGETGEEWFADCSCGCKWFAPLDGRLRTDWGVCTNPASHRVGLLTFEHQGCPQFEMGPNIDREFQRAAAATRARIRSENPTLYEGLYGDQPGRGAKLTLPLLEEDTAVVLLIDLPTYQVHAGDVGRVVTRFSDGTVYGVEISSLAGEVIAVVELEAQHLRPARSDEIAHVRNRYQDAENESTRR